MAAKPWRARNSPCTGGGGRPSSGDAGTPSHRVTRAGDPGWGRAAAGLVVAVTLGRVAQLFLSPLELYPDEAQYWLWSRTLDWGYYSKPPMIAWAIRLTTAAGGDGEPWVRLSAPLFHALAATALAMAGRRWFDGRTAFWTAAVYLLMPGVSLSSQVVATDAPLLAFLGLALWAAALLWTGGGAWAAAALGAALGAAALSKYAAFYAVGGLALHAMVDREGRDRLWTGRRLMLAGLGFAVVWGPNLAWNALHGFQTVAHTAADADLGRQARAERSADLLRPAAFLFQQLGVFGPAPFAALAVAAAAWAGRRLDAAGRLLLWLTAPALVVVTLEAAAARANANWAGAAYAPGALLAARIALVGGRRWRAAMTTSLGVQAVVAVAFSVAMVAPALVDAAGLGSSLKRARGWRAAEATARAWRDEAARSGPVTAVAVDDRFLFNAFAYYGRNGVAAAGSPPLRMWVHEARPQNQAEAAAPLTPAQGGRVAFVSGVWGRESRWDFRRVSGVHETAPAVDRRRSRPLLLYVGEGYVRRPRDPVSGLPTPP